jgi:hypothetical protein
MNPKYRILVSLACVLALFQNCGQDATFSNSPAVTGSSVENQSFVAPNVADDNTNDEISGDDFIDDLIGDLDTDIDLDDDNNNSNNNNNNDVVDNEMDNNNTGGEIDIEVVDNFCETMAPTTQVVNIEFPKPNMTCEWGVDGNLTELNGFLRARIEQPRNLGLPEGAVICDATFDFVQQDFLYDDHFMLLFNDIVIASSYNFSAELQESTYGLLKYDWSAIAGIFWDTSKEEIFCPDIDGALGMSTCAFPGHDQQGTINLTYDADFIRAIMSNGIPSDHSFTMVSIGDNDRMDCEHSDVEFDVAVKYVVPQQMTTNTLAQQSNP